MKRIITLLITVLLIFLTGCSGATDSKTTQGAENDKSTCYLTIECKSVLENKDKLKEGHEEYIPSDGYILNNYKCEYSAGDTAYDILKNACSENNIKLTSESTQYGIYVSGINNIDEFDCGQESGWLYSVNSETPQISYGDYEVRSGDEITFYYVCSYNFD